MDYSRYCPISWRNYVYYLHEIDANKLDSWLVDRKIDVNKKVKYLLYL